MPAFMTLMPGCKPNIFQRVTLQWDGLHPYNAAQVMELDELPSVESVRSAWLESIRELGLKTLGRTRLEAIPDVLEVDSCTEVDVFLSAELNRPFDLTDASYSPFRPFVRSGSDGFQLGVVYHHWAADSASIRLLLREWFFRLFQPALARRTPLTLAEGGFWRHFGPARVGWHLGDALGEAFRWSSKLKSVRRIESAAADLSSAFSNYSTPPGLVEALLPVARSMGATLNDLFLAAIAQACEQHGPAVSVARRRDLALGTIVDLRAGRADLADSFGLFLGFTNVLVRPRDLGDFNALVQTIARQNKRNKCSHAAEASILRMGMGLFAGQFYEREKLTNWYRKRLPLAGGVSNVNLDRDWPASFHPSPLRNFIRVSPAGPIMPLVFTPTTLGRQLQIGLTVRHALIPPPLATQMAGFVIERLADIAKGGIG